MVTLARFIYYIAVEKIMGYFQDAIDVLLLREETYRKIGNDPNAFRKFFKCYLSVSYLILFFAAIVILFGISIGRPALLNLITPFGFFTGLVMFFGIPFFVFIALLIEVGIVHLFGLGAGGSPRRYLDFYTVVSYPIPLILPLAIVFFNDYSALNVLVGIWWLLIVYTSFKTIHRLTSDKAAKALIALIIFEFVIIGIFFVLIIAGLTQSPEAISYLLYSL